MKRKHGFVSTHIARIFWLDWICCSRIKHTIYIFGIALLAFLRFLVQMWYIACTFGIGLCSMNFFRKKKNLYWGLWPSIKTKLLISRVVTLDTSNICEVSNTLYRGLWPSIKIKYFLRPLCRPSKHLFPFRQSSWPSK